MIYFTLANRSHSFSVDSHFVVDIKGLVRILIVSFKTYFIVIIVVSNLYAVQGLLQCCFRSEKESVLTCISFKKSEIMYSCKVLCTVLEIKASNSYLTCSQTSFWGWNKNHIELIWKGQSWPCKIKIVLLIVPNLC